MIELPIILDFDIGNLRLVDSRSAPSNHVLMMREIQVSSLSRYPIDLLCDCGLVRRMDRTIAKRNSTIAGVVDTEKFRDEIEKLRRLGSIRHTKAIFDGTVKGLDFVVYQDDILVGAIQWFGLHIFKSGRRKLVVRGGYFPAFTDDTPNRVVNRRTFRMVMHFLKKDLLMSDNRRLDFQQVAIPRINVSRPDTVLQNEGFALFEEAASERRIEFDSRDDPTQPGRKRVRITDVGRDFIQEPEIDKIISDRARR